MSCLRILGLLALVAAAITAPTGHQVAEQSPDEDQLSAGSLVWPGVAPAPSDREVAAGRTSRRTDDVQVSVSTSSSVEITTVTSSVSSQMSPLPEPAGRPQDGDRSQEEEEEEAPGVELEADQAELQTAVEDQAEVLKSAAEESATAVTSEPAAMGGEKSTSLAQTETETETETETSSAEGEVSASEEPTSAATPEAEVTTATGDSAAQESEEQSPESPAEPTADSESSESSAPANTTAASDSSPEQTSDQASSTKGTLIFDLGPSASAELHDLVQQTVLDALMDEGLLSAIEADAPVIEAEGSGVVFLDETGSGEGEQEAQGRSSPFVSIHF